MSFRVVARCVHGLEWVCAAEVSRSGATDVRMGRREVSFSTDEPAALRTADDVLVAVDREPARPDRGSAAAGADNRTAAADNRPAAAADNRSDVAGLAAALAELPWAAAVDAVRTVREIPPRPVIDIVAAVEGRRRFTRHDVENALGPLLARRLRGSYLRRTAAGREPGNPDLTCRVFVRPDGATAAVRLTRTPLHRRPWRLDVGPGALHPPVAAAMVDLAPGSGALLDPFCGDGTIVIEAALTGTWTDCAGSDADPDRLAAARRNAGRAAVDARWTRRDAGELPPGDARAVVTNPPWNLAVDAVGALTGGLDPFWDRLPGALADGGVFVGITAAELDAPETLRRRGYGVALGVQLRLAGRLCHLTVAAPPGAAAATLPPAAAAWRARAIADGVVTETGF